MVANNPFDFFTGGAARSFQEERHKAAHLHGPHLCCKAHQTVSAFGLEGKIEMLNWRMLSKLCNFMNCMHK